MISYLCEMVKNALEKCITTSQIGEYLSPCSRKQRRICGVVTKRFKFVVVDPNKHCFEEKTEEEMTSICCLAERHRLYDIEEFDDRFILRGISAYASIIK